MAVHLPFARTVEAGANPVGVPPAEAFGAGAASVPVAPGPPGPFAALLAFRRRGPRGA